jgi:misacylated tRNA(Ala) deacylase
MTDALFRDDATLRVAEAKVVGYTDEGGLILDRTIFYATSGGQPGDTGRLRRADGTVIGVTGTVTGTSKDDIVHLLQEGAPRLSAGEPVMLAIDWERRHALMRMHTACHLLSVVCPFPITGASVGVEESRVDLDIPDPTYTKERVTADMMALVAGDHPIVTQWISQTDLEANPGLVKSKNVRPPAGAGRIRLVCIGENSVVDSQPCGGTHVARTSEVGAVHIGKIEKKGRENRRFRIRFGPMPEA